MSIPEAIAYAGMRDSLNQPIYLKALRRDLGDAPGDLIPLLTRHVDVLLWNEPQKITSSDESAGFIAAILDHLASEEAK